MTVLKCDRCGKVYSENEGKRYSILKYSDLTFDILDICPACQSELKQWIEGTNASYTED